MSWVLIFILAIILAELAIRILLAFRYKTFGTASLWRVLDNPEGGMDWRIFSNFGQIDDQRVEKLFRFSTQSSYMGMSDQQLEEIMARANQTNPQTIVDTYSGPKGFEKSYYRPFVGFSTRPNQQLSYAETNDMGFQGSYANYRKPPKTKRVLIFGGSVAYGIGCTDKKYNITVKLEEILNRMEKEQNSETRWEVINLAFVASQSMSEVNQMLIYGALYSPDAVIELAGFNDLYFFLVKKPNLFTYHFQHTVINYLSSTFLEKCLMALSRQLFLVRVLLKFSSLEPQQKEGQLYTVW